MRWSGEDGDSGRRGKGEEREKRKKRRGEGEGEREGERERGTNFAGIGDMTRKKYAQIRMRAHACARTSIILSRGLQLAGGRARSRTLQAQGALLVRLVHLCEHRVRQGAIV